MQKALLTCAAFLVSAAPALAQPAQPAATTDQAQPAAKPRTVTKIVCQKVEVEQSTGSRLSAAPKVCKKVEVPVDSAERSGGSGDSSSHAN